jgi:hypothetical protein
LANSCSHATNKDFPASTKQFRVKEVYMSVIFIVFSGFFVVADGLAFCVRYFGEFDL